MPNTYRPAGPRALRTLRALAAVLGALVLGACGEQPTSIAPVVGDRKAPAVAVNKAAATADTILAFAVDARDDLGLKTVHVRLVGGVSGVFDTTFTSAVTNVSLPYAVA